MIQNKKTRDWSETLYLTFFYSQNEDKLSSNYEINCIPFTIIDEEYDEFGNSEFDKNSKNRITYCGFPNNSDVDDLKYQNMFDSGNRI